MFYYTVQGLRHGEVTGLNALDLSAFDTLTISRQQNNKGQITGLKTPSAYRVLPMPKKIAVLHRTVVTETKQELLKRNITPHGDMPLFVNIHTGNRYHTTILDSVFQKLTDAVGFKVFPHMMRHAFATFSVDAGVNIRDVANYLGHHEIDMTTVYNLGTPEGLQKASNVINL
jgi:site-specific recombinase XerD